MKTQITIFFYGLLFLLSNFYVQAQITPIEITNDGDYIIYKTNQHNEYLQVVEDQSSQIKLSIFESLTKARYNVGSGFDSNFFQSALTTSNYEFLVANRSKNTRFSIIYNIDQSGTYVLSCALRIKANITLSNNEIETILAAAMQHNFVYLKKPHNLTSFYFTVICNYII